MQYILKTIVQKHFAFVKNCKCMVYCICDLVWWCRSRIFKNFEKNHYMILPKKIQRTKTKLISSFLLIFAVVMSTSHLTYPTHVENIQRIFMVSKYCVILPGPKILNIISPSPPHVVLKQPEHAPSSSKKQYHAAPH